MKCDCLVQSLLRFNTHKIPHTIRKSETNYLDRNKLESFKLNIHVILGAIMKYKIDCMKLSRLLEHLYWMFVVYKITWRNEINHSRHVQFRPPWIMLGFSDCFSPLSLAFQSTPCLTQRVTGASASSSSQPGPSVSGSTTNSPVFEMIFGVTRYSLRRQTQSQLSSRKRYPNVQNLISKLHFFVKLLQTFF